MPKRSSPWSLQDAKAHFSKLVRETLETGPQLVTRNGEEVVMIVSVKDYRRLADRRSSARKPQSFGQFLASSPLSRVELDLTRARDTTRDTDL